MNRIFKVVWSKAKQCRVVVSEIAKSYLKSSESHSRHLRLLVSLLTIFSFNYGNYFALASSFSGSFPSVNSVASIFSASNMGTDSHSFETVEVFNSSSNGDVYSLPYGEFFVSDDDYHIVGTDRRGGFKNREHFYLYNSKNQQVADLGFVDGTDSFLNSFENFKLVKGGTYAFSRSVGSSRSGDDYSTYPTLSIVYFFNIFTDNAS